MKIIGSFFFSYVVILTSGILYVLIFNNPLIWPVVFALVFFISFISKEKLNQEQLNFIKISFIFLITYFTIGILANQINLNIVDNSEINRQIIKTFSSLIITPLFVFKFVSSSNAINFYNKLFIVLGILNFLLQIFQVINPGLFYDYFSDDYLRSGGFISNPNITALFYIFILTILTTVKTRFSVAFKLVFFIATVLTYSRTGILGYLMIILYQNINLKSVLMLFRLLMIIIFLALILNYFSDSNQFQRIFQYFEAFEQSRLQLWMFSLDQIFKNSLFLGLGLLQMDNIVYWLGSEGLGPHNLYIYILGSAGIIPLFIFTVLVLQILSNFSRNNMLSVPILIIIILTTFFNHDLLRSPIYWLIISYLYNLKNTIGENFTSY